MRLFPNPAFDEDARKKWDAERYYRDPKYYESRDLIKPYRVGMSCGFCHVGPDPVRPPADPENPRWANLSSSVGAQYFWVDRIFNWKGDTNAKSFFFQLFHTSRPGSLDTSLVSSDNINNPRTMNAVYLLGPRMGLAKKWGKETLAGGGLDNRQFNEFVPPGDPLAQFFQAPSTTWTPRVLKDGSDSVGALGALNRVYLNIGLFSEEWLHTFHAAHRRHGHLADRDRRGAQELGVLGRDRAPDAVHGAVLPQGVCRPSPARRARRSRASHRRRRDPQAGQSRVRRALRALPLEQDPAAAGGTRPRERQRQGLSRRLEHVLGVDEDRSPS